GRTGGAWWRSASWGAATPGDSSPASPRPPRRPPGRGPAGAAGWRGGGRSSRAGPARLRGRRAVAGRPAGRPAAELKADPVRPIIRLSDPTQEEAPTMRAIRVHQYGGPEAMKLDEVPTPRPGAGQALVRLEAAGINFIDVYQRTGLYKGELPLRL